MGRKKLACAIVVGMLVISTIFFMCPLQLNTVEAALSHGKSPIGPGNNTSAEDLAGAPYDESPSGDWQVIWGPLNNPHYIEDNYTVEMGWNLIILPGCDIRFEPGTRLIVQGGLTVEGADVGITFTSNQSLKNPGDWDGIYVEGGFINIFNNSNLEYSKDGVHVSNWGMLGGPIQNCFIHDNLNYGVYLEFVMGGPMVQLNEIYNNSYGVMSLSSSLMMWNNEVYDNDNGVLTGIAPGSFPMGPWLWQNNITNNLEDGIIIAGDMPGITDNNITFNGRHGIFAYKEPSIGPMIPWIQDNKIENNTEAGIRLDEMNPEIWQNTILNGTYGIYLNSSLTNITDSIIQGWSDSGILTEGVNSSLVFVENSTLSSPSGYSFSLNDDSHITTLNTTFDKSTVNIQDGLSNLTVNWWVHIKVNESDGDPAQGAQVWLNNSLGATVRSDTTDTQGRIEWIQVTEYIQGFGAVDFDTHIGSAINNSEWGTTYANIDSYRTIYINLGSVSDFLIPLLKGWNMISIPLNQTDTTLGKVLESIDGQYGAVQWYDITDPNDYWKHYKVGKTMGTDLFKINNKMGIWIFLDNSDTLYAQGDILATTNIQLYTGWNFVGYPSLKTRTLVDGLSSIAGKYDAVWSFNASDSLDPWKSEFDGDLTQMNPGEGYWIHATEDCAWKIDGL
jgi:hypothetical protein